MKLPRLFQPTFSQKFMLAFHLLLTNQGSLMEHTHIWKNGVPDIYAMPYIMLPNMSATGILHLPNIWQRNEPKANITMLPYPMLSKNLFGLFIISNRLINNTPRQLNFFLIQYSFFEHL